MAMTRRVWVGEKMESVRVRVTSGGVRAHALSPPCGMR